MPPRLEPGNAHEVFDIDLRPVLACARVRKDADPRHRSRNPCPLRSILSDLSGGANGDIGELIGRDPKNGFDSIGSYDCQQFRTRRKELAGARRTGRDQAGTRRRHG